MARAEAEGFARVLRALIEQNLADDPGRRRFLRDRWSVVVSAPDAGVTATVRCFPGEVVVAPGPAPDAQLRITADAAQLLETAAVPLRMGSPDVLDERGRALLRDLFRGRVRVAGFLRHPLVLRRFMRLLSVVGGGG
jgi:hypothetical protein